MANLITDLKRAWRLTKLIRASELSDEEALNIEKVDSVYMAECLDIRNELVQAKKSFGRDLAKARKSLNQEAITSRQSLNRNFNVSTKTIGQQFTNLENSLSSSILKISQLLEASQKASASRLDEAVTTSKTTMELVNGLREYVGKQADETRRWQEGYDWRILKTYLLRVVSTLDDIETKLEFYKNNGKSEELIKDFDFLRETLEIHLEEEGLLAFSPKLGEEPDASLVDIKAGVTISEDAQVVGAVAEVIHRGYEIDLGTETKVVRKAQVSVYKK
jgi:molecular chaperone GrpE (heat shock protein)